MTQTQLLSYCRLKIPEINDTSVISDVNLLIVLNLACTEFIKRTEALPTYSTFNLVTNQSEYNLSTYVTNFGKIRKEGLWIYNASTSKWTQLDATSMEVLSRDYPSWMNTSANIPLRYSLDGNVITIYPKASSTYAGTDYLKLFYYAKSTDMSASGHYPFSGSTTQYPHLAEYERDLIDYVRYEVKQMLNKDADAEEAKAAFYAKCLEAKQALKYRPDLIREMRTVKAGGIAAAKEAFK